MINKIEIRKIYQFMILVDRVGYLLHVVHNNERKAKSNFKKIAYRYFPT